TIPSGANATISVVVTVNHNTPQGTTINNTASAAMNTTFVIDPNGGNNSATQTTAVDTQADLVVTKTDDPDPVIAGNNVTYTITVTDNGPSDAQNVQVTDSVPANTTFVSAAPSQGTASQSGGVITASLGAV